MSNLALISVALRVVGIWLIWLHGFRLANMALNWPPGDDTSSFLLFFIGSLIPLLIGLAFLIVPLSVTRFLVPNAAKDNGKTDWMPQDLGAVAIGVTGIAFFVSAVGSPELWNVVLFLADVQRGTNGVSGGDFLAGVLRLLVGITLVVWAAGFSRALQFGRRARLDNKLFEEDT